MEYGYIRTDALLDSIKTLDDLIALSLKLNIREKLSFIKNFQEYDTINCIMYNILLEYNKNKEEFQKKINNDDSVNIKQVEKIIKTIETLLDINLEETDLCYDTDFNVHNCDGTYKKLYHMVNDKTTFKEETVFDNDFPRICNLWIPFVDLFGYQHLVKAGKYNRLKYLIESYKYDGYKKGDYRCVNEILQKYPLLEELTTREIDYITVETGQPYNPKELPWFLVICHGGVLKQGSFYLKLRERKNKLSISYSSGNTLIFLLLTDYIKNISLPLIIISLIIWMVPYHHSINEILSAAKMYGCFDEYNYNNTTLENINILLQKAGLKKI